MWKKHHYGDADERNATQQKLHLILSPVPKQLLES
jgi:hypothetical protein